MQNTFWMALPFLFLIIAIWVVALGIVIAFYVIGAIGTYTVAKRRGLKRTWLSWLPIGNMYVYGAISDDVMMLRGIAKKYRNRVLLPVMDGCAFGGMVLVFVLIFCLSLGMALDDPNEFAASAFPFVIVPFFVLAVLLIYAVMIASRVFASIALYPVYREYCFPGTSMALAVCGGIFGLHGVFLFAIRNKIPLAAYTGPVVF